MAIRKLKNEGPPEKDLLEKLKEDRKIIEEIKKQNGSKFEELPVKKR